jgi:hypothetical protein
MIVNSVHKGHSVIIIIIIAIITCIIIIIIVVVVVIGGGAGGGGGGGGDCCCFCSIVTGNIDEGLSVEGCGKGSSFNLCVFLGVK